MVSYELFMGVWWIMLNDSNLGTECMSGNVRFMFDNKRTHLALTSCSPKASTWNELLTKSDSLSRKTSIATAKHSSVRAHQLSSGQERQRGTKRECDPPGVNSHPTCIHGAPFDHSYHLKPHLSVPLTLDDDDETLNGHEQIKTSKSIHFFYLNIQHYTFRFDAPWEFDLKRDHFLYYVL